MAEISTSHVVIDMLNDFITGSMACLNADNAMAHIISYINAHPNDLVFYAADCHPRNHCSFVQNGGEWPTHCVAHTTGQEIHLQFYTRFSQANLRPHRTRIFMKGCNPAEEEYSAFNAKNPDGKALCEVLSKNVTISGIATEYCVFNTVKDLVEAGYNVQVLENGLGYVDLKGHKATLEKLKSLGVKLI